MKKLKNLLYGIGLTALSLNSFSQNREKYLENIVPYQKEIVISDESLKQYAKEITQGCKTKECEVSKIYSHILENYEYEKDSNGKEIIKNPYETFKDKKGDCEDLTILLNSLLENMGIDTYLVWNDREGYDTINHIYNLTCGIDLNKIAENIHSTRINKLYNDFLKKGLNVKKVDGDLFLQVDINKSVWISPNDFYALGSPGEELEKVFDWKKIEYKLNSTKPLDLLAVPTMEDYQNFVDGKKYQYYVDSKKENVSRLEEDLGKFNKKIALIIQNNNSEKAHLDLQIRDYRHISNKEILKDVQIKNYKINQERCIVLEPSFEDRESLFYPGAEGENKGENIAIGSKTKELIYLGKL